MSNIEDYRWYETKLLVKGMPRNNIIKGIDLIAVSKKQAIQKTIEAVSKTGYQWLVVKIDAKEVTDKNKLNILTGGCSSLAEKWGCGE